MVSLFYTIHISVDHAQHEIFHAKVGKGGINILCLKFCLSLLLHKAGTKMPCTG